MPRKCHNHEAQPSQGTKRRRDEEQIMTKLSPFMKPQTHAQRIAIKDRLGKTEDECGKYLYFLLY